MMEHYNFCADFYLFMHKSSFRKMLWKNRIKKKKKNEEELTCALGPAPISPRVARFASLRPSRAAGVPSPPFPSLTGRVHMAATAPSPTSVRFESDGVQRNRPRSIPISQGFDLLESFLSTVEPTVTSFSIYRIREASLTLVWQGLDPAELVPKPPP